jgi:Tfp pilus assembly protein PilX
MQIKQRGFTLIIVMTVLMVLSLIVMASFEQAQWVKRSQYYVWLQVKMQDRLWQQLALAEAQLPQRELTGKCFLPYSVSNDYFFTANNPSLTTACIYTLADEQIGVIYEQLMTQPCAQIKGNAQTGVNFFRISVRSQLKDSGQRMTLQAVEAKPFVDNNNTKKGGMDIVCTEYAVYEAGQQSWLLQ